MWFKKKSVLQAEGHYNTEKSADGITDMRTTDKSYSNGNSSINNSGLPSAADAGNYFYLPASGSYLLGQLYLVGDYGCYWSSSANPQYGSNPQYGGFVYYLFFSSGDVNVGNSGRYYGYRVEPTFE